MSEEELTKSQLEVESNEKESLIPKQNPNDIIIPKHKFYTLLVFIAIISIGITLLIIGLSVKLLIFPYDMI